MAKKKTADEELDEELLDVEDDFEELDGIDLEDSTAKTKDELAELLSSQLEEEIKGIEYKFLEVSIERENETEYYITIKHQSHGFMNYLVSKVLKCKDVEFAAYKATSLAPPKLYIRTTPDHDIKVILKEALTLMRTEWKGMKNAVAAMKL
jgi:DNA-directed RNA polymerase subunit L